MIIENKKQKIKPAFVGICGSDIQKVALNKNFKKSNLGHEIVVKIDRKYYVVNPMIGCGKCQQCNTKNVRFCEQLKAIGRNLPGAFCEVLLVPPKNLNQIKLKNPRIGILCDPYAVVVKAMKNTKNISKVLIVGDGTLGFLSASYLFINRQNIGEVTILTKTKERYDLVVNFKQKLQTLNLETEIKIHHSNYDVKDSSQDLVVEAVGRDQANTLNSSIQKVKNGGRIISLGVFPQNYKAELLIRNLLYKEVKLIGSNSYEQEDLDVSIQQIYEHESHFSSYLGVCYSLDELNEAFDKAKSKSAAPYIKNYIEV